MAGDLLSIGVSGLLAFQRSLTTTSHNVANVATPGYSRQTTDLEATPGQLFGSSYLGSGVRVVQVRRQYENFVNAQIRTATASHSEMEVLESLASRVDNLLGDSEAGLAPALQRFFGAVQGVANDPASVPARQVMLSEATCLSDRFQAIDGQLTELRTETNSRLGETVADINSFASAIAGLNKQIVTAQAAGGGGAPNDLLDQRDTILAKLVECVSVNILSRADGSVDVLVGGGQPLVLGPRAAALAVQRAAGDPSQLDITYTSGGAPVVVTRNMGGGMLGGLLGFQSKVLDPAQSGLGRIALGLAQTFNAQHRSGMDLNGQLGGDFFAISEPQVLSNPDNGGNASVTATLPRAGAPTTSDYELSFDGANYTLTRLSDNVSQVGASGTPPALDGLTLTVSGMPNAGDRFLIRPSHGAASDFSVSLISTNQIAAAAPVRSRSGGGNTGDGVISAGQVLDATHPNLMRSIRLQFDTPPTTFDIVDEATSNIVASDVPYASGADIDLNGWRVQISGSPQANDTFIVESNERGFSDNRNALLLAGLQTTGTLEGGSATYAAAYGQLVSLVGASTRQAQISRDAQAAVLGHAKDTRESISGVNLDEEAANMVRLQQSYQAAARVISVADSLFQTLLDAVRR